MENNCMANPCEGCTEEACVEMMKKLQADKKVRQLLETGKDSNGEEVFGCSRISGIRCRNRSSA